MPEAYRHCEVAAVQAGQKQKEVMYRKKSLEAAAAISKIFKRIYEKTGQAQAKKRADLEEMMERFGLAL